MEGSGYYFARAGDFQPHNFLMAGAANSIVYPLQSSIAMTQLKPQLCQGYYFGHSDSYP